MSNEVERIVQQTEALLRLRHEETLQETTPQRLHECLGEVIMMQINDSWVKTKKRQTAGRRAFYFSAEYLVGRLVYSNLFNLGILSEVKKAFAEKGVDLACLEEIEDAALGNGGLGRLAACFLDSAATCDVPLTGYGLRYRFGLFKQSFENGSQRENADDWTKFGDPWSHRRDKLAVKVNFANQTVIAVPYDMPVIGFENNTIGTLRLWQCEAEKELDFDAFNAQNYVKALETKNKAEDITRVLYPNDSTLEGKQLRIKQQYVLSSASLQDILRSFRENHGCDYYRLPEFDAVQLNDTHPAIAVPELMRLMMDVHGLPWDEAWAMCEKIFAYTNHTLLPEALEKWSVSFFEKLLPRHLQIIYEINARWLRRVAEKYPNDPGKQEALSIIEEGSPKMMRMAYLAVVGSFSVNGVAALHTELLKNSVLRDFYDFSPEKFNNKTNGVTPRRWLKSCNPGLSALIDAKVPGVCWPKDLDAIRALENYAENEDFQREFMRVKFENKKRMAAIIKEKCGIEVSPEAMFDVQIKRLHEYKRQHLNLLHILTLYKKLLHNPDMEIAPRVFIFGAKAAPGYDIAKNIIFAINKVGEKINSDPRIKGKLKVAFIPNYSVSLAMSIIPAADLSEQISTAGKEASGTGNMKLALNGAATIGTLDGANIEILDAVGEENMFIFGMNVEEVQERSARGYNTWAVYSQNKDLKDVLDWLVSDYFMPDNPNAFMPLRKSLLDWGDPFMVCADYQSYCDVQQKVDEAFRDKKRWAKIAINNTARMGFFSSDRTIREYAEDIWDLKGDL